MVILISDNIFVKPKLIRRPKEGHYILIKEKIHQENIAILITYATYTRSRKFIKETLLELKSHIDSHTLVVRSFSTLLSPVDRSSRQKCKQSHLTLKYQMNFTDIYKIFHLNTKKNMLSSAQHLTEHSPKLITYMYI